MNKFEYNVNPFIIGIIIAYSALGIHQLLSNQMLPNSVYMTIACVSSELSIIEIAKLLLVYFELDLDGALKDMGSKDYVSEDELNRLRTNKRILFFMRYIIYLGYVMVAFFIISFPFKIVPYDFVSNKLIAVATIFTFVFTFIYYALNQYLISKKTQ